MTCCKERVQGIEGCSLRPAAPCVHDYIRGFQSSPPAWISIRVCVLERVRVCVNVRERERERKPAIQLLPFTAGCNYFRITEILCWQTGQMRRFSSSELRNTVEEHTQGLSILAPSLSLSVMSRHL